MTRIGDIYNIRRMRYTDAIGRSIAKMAEQNELDRIRMKLGISRPEMLRALGMREGREAPFSCPPERLDPLVLHRAYELEQLYETWKSTVISTAILTAVETLDRDAYQTARGDFIQMHGWLENERYLPLLKVWENNWKEGSTQRRKQYREQNMHLSIQDLAQIFKTYNSKIVHLCDIGLLGDIPDEYWRSERATFTIDDIRRLFLRNEKYLITLQKNGRGRGVARRAPLGGLFMAWLRQNHNEDFIQSSYPSVTAGSATS